jgi:integrase
MGIFQRDGSWFIDFYVGSRRVRERVGTSKGEAIRALSIREGEVAQGKFLSIAKRGGLRFEALADRYFDLVSVHKRGRHVERFIIKTLKEFFGKQRVSELTAEDAERYKAARSRDVKPATVNREVAVAKHMLTKAAEWKMIPDNPFREVRSLSVPKSVERVLGREEETKLLAACGLVRTYFLRPVIVVALGTGMRRGELLSLEWSQVDLANRTIRIVNAKSDAGSHTIPMNATVHSLLLELERTKDSHFVFPSNRKPGTRILDLKTGFHKAVRSAGIPHIRFHDLRHTFATRLVQAGVDIITVQHLLGHAKITMTARYAHSQSEVRVAAVNKLDFAAVCSSPDSNRTPTPFEAASDIECKRFGCMTIGP